ncbi:hypothetical protein DPMN_180123 [Dreissena polymorpha]|uniref:Uncharacterized protein n=1 Tax=Dreissena polymorpha TaxID=45954 RepID=A0A9D4IP43_DREPO|nr:hypothetical protein DPMN_180123 [Dreissena polymorpha]
MHVYLMELHILSGERSRSRSSFKVKVILQGVAKRRYNRKKLVRGVQTCRNLYDEFICGSYDQAPSLKVDHPKMVCAFGGKNKLELTQVSHEGDVTIFTKLGQKFYRDDLKAKFEHGPCQLKN